MPNRVDRPVPGWYRRRLVKGGPWVPVLLFVPCPLDPHTGEPLDRPRHPLCLIADDPADAMEQWSWVAGQPISRAEYLYLMAVRAHAIAHEPEMPEANPRRPIDLLRAPLPF